MKVNITGRHLEITQSMKDYVVEKAERLTRYFDRISRLQITLSVEGDRHIAEMLLTAKRGVTLIGEEIAGDMVDVESGESAEVARRTGEHADVLAVLDEESDQP